MRKGAIRESEVRENNQVKVTSFGSRYTQTSQPGNRLVLQ